MKSVRNYIRFNMMDQVGNQISDHVWNQVFKLVHGQDMYGVIFRVKDRVWYKLKGC